MDLKDIKAIIDLMKKNSISEFELERQDFKIRLKRGPNAGAIPIQYDEIPTLAAFKKGPGKLLFAGWQANGIWTLRTGFPFTVFPCKCVCGWSLIVSAR